MQERKKIIKKIKDDKFGVFFISYDSLRNEYENLLNFTFDVVILDEAQNSTRSQMKMLLTRMGQNTKMIINGDVSQIDLIKKADSGLIEAVRLLKGIPSIYLIHLSQDDVVRNPLVQKIIERYAEIEK